MKLTRNQMEILINLLNTLDVEITNKVHDYKDMPNNMDFHEELKQCIKEIRVIRSVTRKLKEEIKRQ